MASCKDLDDELKAGPNQLDPVGREADCLERLVGVAQRAPMVRRPSWSSEPRGLTSVASLKLPRQLAEEERPESDDEARPRGGIRTHAHGAMDSL